MATDSYVNFRLRGIPRALLDESHVRDLIHMVFSSVPRELIHVRSLADNPVEPNSRVATLNFATVPTPLSDRSKDEWKVDFPENHKDAKHSTFRTRKLVFDTHFKGITPLHSKADEECPIEYCHKSFLLAAATDAPAQSPSNLRPRGPCFRFV